MKRRGPYCISNRLTGEILYRGEDVTQAIEALAEAILAPKKGNSAPEPIQEPLKKVPQPTLF